jgi:hypothetical protein
MGGAETLDRSDLRGTHLRHAFLTASNGLAIQMDRTSSTESNSATILGAGQIQQIAKNPQQGHLWICIDSTLLPIYMQEKFGHIRACR